MIMDVEKRIEKLEKKVEVIRNELIDDEDYLNSLVRMLRKVKSALDELDNKYYLPTGKSELKRA